MKLSLSYNIYNYAHMESYKPELYINLVCKEFTFNYCFKIIVFCVYWQVLF